MFVITADQVGSRTEPDSSGGPAARRPVAAGARAPGRRGRRRAPARSPPTPGHARHRARPHARRALERRSRRRRRAHPAAHAVVEATGPAFYAAREAVTAAKRADSGSPSRSTQTRRRRRARAPPTPNPSSPCSSCSARAQVRPGLGALRPRARRASAAEVRGSRRQPGHLPRLAAVSARAKAASLRAELDASPRPR